MTQAPERDAERVEDAKLHALLFPEQTVEWHHGFRMDGVTPFICRDNCDGIAELSSMEPGGMWHPVPRYGADDDWSGMRAVIAAMRERGWTDVELTYEEALGVWIAGFWKSLHRNPYGANHITAPQAVRAAARAALEREAL